LLQATKGKSSNENFQSEPMSESMLLWQTGGTIRQEIDLDEHLPSARLWIPFFKVVHEFSVKRSEKSDLRMNIKGLFLVSSLKIFISILNDTFNHKKIQGGRPFREEAQVRHV
jgi:hypothetical protein